ncbi:hypothetical protein LCGC14_2761190 [marine sediment metagenome]|uniref:Nucleotide exchange factor GrpE n=1 Tax=marine sediment metagenome TaxID=412755 RepID=A0A0F9BQH9_9ZZZZ
MPEEKNNESDVVKKEDYNKMVEAHNTLKVEKEKLEKEIEATKETISKLKQIEKDSITGIEINEIVLKAFENALKKATPGGKE